MSAFINYGLLDHSINRKKLWNLRNDWVHYLNQSNYKLAKSTLRKAKNLQRKMIEEEAAYIRGLIENGTCRSMEELVADFAVEGAFAERFWYAKSGKHVSLLSLLDTPVRAQFVDEEEFKREYEADRDAASRWWGEYAEEVGLNSFVWIHHTSPSPKFSITPRTFKEVRRLSVYGILGNTSVKAQYVNMFPDSGERRFTRSAKFDWSGIFGMKIPEKLLIEWGVLPDPCYPKP